MDHEIEYPQRIRGGAGWFPEEGVVEIEGYEGARITLIENGLSNGDPPVINSGNRVLFNPIWELGGDLTVAPSIGSGTKKGEVVAIPLADGRIGCRMNIDLVSARSPNPTQPGQSSGSYEFYLPETMPTIWPHAPVMDSEGNIISHDFVRGAGAAIFWIAGSGVKHFTGSCKWTFREWRDGGPANPRPKIIVIVNGDEWTPTYPKMLGGADWNMALTINWAV